MSVELSVSSSQGRTAEWHDTVQLDGTRKGDLPKNCDAALAYLNEHWYGDLATSDGDKFNAIYQPTIDAFNAGKKPCRQMGPTSSKEERKKDYYTGIVDGTWCTGTGDMKEQAVYEAVWQIGNKDDNGTTDASFDIKHWETLKKAGRTDEASAYALEHLNPNTEQQERTKRILKRAADRIINHDPEHLVVLRVDYHGDEPCGTPGIHIAYTLRGTGYKSGMTERCGSVTALKQMGFVKTKTSEYGITQLHEFFKDVIEEEMQKDAIEYGYEPIKRKAPTGEKRTRSDVDVFREMASLEEDLDEYAEELQQQRNEIAERESKVAEAEQDIKTRQKKQDDRDSRQATKEEHLKKVAERQSQIKQYQDQNHRVLQGMSKQNDEKAKQFQEWEDSLDAQRKVQDEREAALKEQEAKLAEERQAAQEACKIFKQAGDIRKGQQEAVPETLMEFLQKVSYRVLATTTELVLKEDMTGWQTKTRYKKNENGKAIWEDRNPLTDYQTYLKAQERGRSLTAEEQLIMDEAEKLLDQYGK